MIVTSTKHENTQTVQQQQHISSWLTKVHKVKYVFCHNVRNSTKVQMLWENFEKISHVVLTLWSVWCQNI